MSIVMINVKRIAGLILLVLLSQQALASLRVITPVFYLQTSTPACSQHPAHHAQHPCEMSNEQASHSMASTGLLMSDHKGMDGTHCENCVSGCQSLVFSHSIFHTARLTSTYAISEYHPFVPMAPFHILYRPPITA